MQATDVNINLQNGEGTLKAFAKVTFDGVLVIGGFKVVEGEKGLFVSMPQFVNKNEEWKDQVYPRTKELREQVTEKVLSSYRKVADKAA